ncbi:MAG TPA: EAL domain-containing protein [Burkholderiales bacterium]|jgi:diguanylate cyclase (GGDEF)-like protein/PAS domain S-box-containing protein|nr:EAL domain-containing protein [Burkholderiales bacterium]
MLSHFSSRHSRNVLAGGFGLLLILLIAVTVMALVHLETIHQRINGVVQDHAAKTALVSNMLRITRERSQVLYSLFSIGDDSERAAAYQRYRNLAGNLDAVFSQFRKLDLTADERAAINTAHRAEVASDTVRDRIAQLLADRQPDAARQLLLTRGISVQDRFEESLDALLDAKRGVTMDAVANANRVTGTALLLVAVASFLTLLIGAIVAVWVTRYAIRIQDALFREKEMAEFTLASIGDGVITTDAEGRVDYLNMVAERYTGWSTAEARGRPLSAVYRVFDEKGDGPLTYPVATGDLSADADADENGATLRLIHRDGSEHAVRDSSSPITDRGGEIVGMIVVFHDVSHLKAMAQQLSWQASHDPLTGLVNRREFERRLGELLETSKHDGRRHALLYLDLDHFKRVNDTCGHSAGDELLRQISTVVVAHMRASDTLGRIGGDEFGALLESCPPDQAVRIANGVREAVRGFRFSWNGYVFGVGLSIGLVPLDGGSGDLQQVMAQADACCYRAKGRGGDSVQVYRREGSEHREPHMVAYINRALEHGNFRLFRQKIVALAGEPDGAPHYEVLVRMIDRQGRHIAPTRFMPVAERYNLLTSIDRWVIATLVEYLYREHAAGAIRGGRNDAGFHSVNMTGASLNDNSFAEFLRRLLTDFHLPSGMLCFEVTETVAIANLAKAAELMQELRTMGCRIALDDFGTGMSSFAYLKHLPVDYLKIAGEFIGDIANDPMGKAIVDAINRIGHTLGMQTVAEVVTDQRTFDTLKALGVDFAQGYFVAEPEALITIAPTSVVHSA